MNTKNLKINVLFIFIALVVSGCKNNEIRHTGNVELYERIYERICILSIFNYNFQNFEKNMHKVNNSIVLANSVEFFIRSFKVGKYDYYCFVDKMNGIVVSGRKEENNAIIGKRAYFYIYQKNSRDPYEGKFVIRIPLIRSVMGDYIRVFPLRSLALVDFDLFLRGLPNANKN